MATTATDGAPQLSNYQPVCDIDQFTLFQIWKSSKTGILKQVSVNIAASVQTVPLTLDVFKFSSIQDLVSSAYKYTLLATALFNSTSLSYVFNTASLYPNATVSQGDYLGLSIAGSDFAPYCYLEYSVAGGNQILLQQGSGQNSLRGLTESASPVYARIGKGLKFFAVVEGSQDGIIGKNPGKHVKA
ncbi:hypothetical protein AOQ84DRAFT_384686 [Glonium stellatum]|uniref:Uncharacterized protein n=1 Tax=Glonium stellatum TaxID=574774 RepID=A0A8E2FCM8_9PEZI|nr:hypothetical protein AOQ84DRAFT_384686 [Glonium stellatum]